MPLIAECRILPAHLDTTVEILGLNEASATLIDRFAVHDKPEAIDSLMGH